MSQVHEAVRSLIRRSFELDEGDDQISLCEEAVSLANLEGIRTANSACRLTTSERNEAVSDFLSFLARTFPESRQENKLVAFAIENQELDDDTKEARLPSRFAGLYRHVESELESRTASIWRR